MPATTTSSITPRVFHLYATNQLTARTMMPIQAIQVRNQQEVSMAILMTIIANMGNFSIMRYMYRLMRQRVDCFYRSSIYRRGFYLQAKDGQGLGAEGMGLGFRAGAMGLGGFIASAVLLVFMVVEIYLGEFGCYFLGSWLSNMVEVASSYLLQVRSAIIQSTQFFIQKLQASLTSRMSRIRHTSISIAALQLTNRLQFSGFLMMLSMWCEGRFQVQTSLYAYYIIMPLRIDKTHEHGQNIIEYINNHP